jgi:hypothetical protein
MAEQQLDAAQISPGIQQVCRERVAQNMRAQPSCLRSFWHTTRTAFAFSGSPGRFP